MARPLLFGFLALGLVLMLADHLLSPPIHVGAGAADTTACAPCGAPCPSTR